MAWCRQDAVVQRFQRLSTRRVEALLNRPESQHERPNPRTVLVEHVVISYQRRPLVGGHGLFPDPCGRAG